MPVPLTPGNPYYYTDDFKTVIRSCKEILLSKAFYAPFLEPSVKFAYRYNFQKFLREIGKSAPSVPEDLIWVICFINDIENPNADFSHLDGFWVVNKDNVQSVIQASRVIRED